MSIQIISRNKIVCTLGLISLVSNLALLYFQLGGRGSEGRNTLASQANGDGRSSAAEVLTGANGSLSRNSLNSINDQNIVRIAPSFFRDLVSWEGAAGLRYSSGSFSSEIDDALADLAIKSKAWQRDLAKTVRANLEFRKDSKGHYYSIRPASNEQIENLAGMIERDIDTSIIPNFMREKLFMDVGSCSLYNEMLTGGDIYFEVDDGGEVQFVSPSLRSTIDLGTRGDSAMKWISERYGLLFDVEELVGSLVPSPQDDK